MRIKAEDRERLGARSCSGPCATLGAHPVNCLVLWCKLPSLNASILVIFLADILAPQVSFSTKKESFNLEFIKALKSGVKVSLSSFAPSFTLKVFHFLNDLQIMIFFWRVN